MDKQLVERIRTGLITASELASENAEEVLAIKRDTSAPQSRFFAEKAYGVDSGKRQVTGVPHSTEGVDRMGDIIRVKGWQLDAYRKNPVLLFGHDKGSLPIAKALKVRKGQSATGMRSLLIDEQYHEADVNPQSELVWRMVESGALPGRSVGFLPIEVHEPESDAEREKLGLGKYGLEFRSQELLESSIVPVPANAEALQGKCYAIAQATAKKAVEDGVATWSDVQQLAGILPITDEDQSRINREQRRSHVAFTEGTGNEVIDVSNELTMSTTGTVGIGISTGCAAYPVRSAEDIATIADLENENKQLREQVADLTRAIGVLAKTTEDRSECADPEEPEVESRSNDEAEESNLYDILLEKVEERKRRRQFSEELKRRLETRLGTGEGPKE